MSTIGFIGIKQNFKLKSGATFGDYEMTIFESNGTTPRNITGYTFSGNIKKKNSNILVATMTFTMVNALAGKVKFGIPANITATLKGNSKGDSEYVYDIDYTDLNNVIEPIMFGDIEVVGNV